MKLTLPLAALGLWTALLATPAAASVLNFDDLAVVQTPQGPVGNFFDSLANSSYLGFTFANEGAARWFWNPNPDANGGPYNAASGPNWLGVDSATNFAPAITSAVDFVFDGASFAGYDPIRYRLYNDGVLVFTSDAATLGLTHRFVASGYSGLVDKVVIENLTPADLPPAAYYAMDNFTYNTNVVSEPATPALVVASLGLLLLARRQRRPAA